MGWGRRFWRGSAVAVAVLVAAPVAPAPAGQARVTNLTGIADVSPFAWDCQAVTIFPQVKQVQQQEFEPHIAVDPTDPDRMAAVWIDLTTLTTRVAGSTDGGATWTRPPLPGARCTGDETVHYTLDPQVAFGQDGTAYVSTLSTGTPTRVRVNASFDGGRSWGDAAEAHRDAFDDRPVLATDARDASKAYVAFAPGAYGGVLLVRTEDGGRTWSLPSFAAPPDDEWSPWPNVLLSPAQDSVVLVYSLINPYEPVQPFGPLRSVRSDDGGRTWSAPATIADLPQGYAHDPDTGQKLRSQSFAASAAAAPDGTLYATWQANPSKDEGRIMFASSRDGKRWSTPAPIATVAGQVFTPTVAVTPEGTLGVYWYDFRRDRPGDAELTTDVWFAHSHDGGATWRESHVHGPFDARRTDSDPEEKTFAPAYFGDYSGFAGMRRGFAAAFVATGDLPESMGTTDLMFARIAVND